MGSSKKKRSNRGGRGGGSGGSGGSSSSRSYCGEAAAAVAGRSSGPEIDLEAELDVTKWRGEEAPRKTVDVEIALAEQIAEKLKTSKDDHSATPLRATVPNVDLTNIVLQMQGERERFHEVHRSGDVSYHDLTRYGLFLAACRKRLQEEHKRASQKQLISKALADRSRGEREWSQRSAALERANQHMHRLSQAALSLNVHVSELQGHPLFVRAMAETRARDMVLPGWDRSFAPPPRKEDDVDEDISFESLLRLEKESGAFGSFLNGAESSQEHTAGATSDASAS